MSTDQQKEWKIEKTVYDRATVFIVKDKAGRVHRNTIENDLLDQIRREAFEQGKMEFAQTYPHHKKALQLEAKKELLDEVNLIIEKTLIMRPDLKNLFLFEQLKELRAKTLREKLN